MDTLSAGVASPEEAPAMVRVLDAAQAADGAGLAQRFSEEQIHAYLQAMPSIVARQAGIVVGVLLVQPLPQGEEAGPVTAAMLRAWPPPVDAYIYGPIAVAPELRGRGVAALMANALLRRMGDRQGVLFIDEGNAASLKAHGRMGFVLRAGFECRGRRFVVLTTR